MTGQQPQQNLPEEKIVMEKPMLYELKRELGKWQGKDLEAVVIGIS
jgi:hypothetical protein